MTKPLTPSADHFRAEIARHRLSRVEIAELIGMNVNQLSEYCSGARTIPLWARYNIAYGINRAVGYSVFDVDMRLGLAPAKREAPKYFRNPQTSVRMSAPPRRST
jgi:transcriptional regulator with XRE-family HTH domain